MASTSSREAALERRRALTNGGKKAESRFMSTPGRTRTASDARPSRTLVTPPPPAAPASRRHATAFTPATLAPRDPGPPGNGLRSTGRARMERPIPNPSRELVLQRREALSRRGKRADTSRDRTRGESIRSAPRQAAPASAGPEASGPAPSQALADSGPWAGRSGRTASLAGLAGSLASRAGGNGSYGKIRSSTKRSAQYNPSRALVLARREALSKRGKSAIHPGTNTAATVARQGNPDISTREPVSYTHLTLPTTPY